LSDTIGSTTTAPDNSILSIHRSFSAGRCRSWWYHSEFFFFFLITHGDLLSRLLPSLSSRSALPPTRRANLRYFSYKLFMSGLHCRR